MVRPKKDITGTLDREPSQRTPVERRKLSARQAAKPTPDDGAQPLAIAPDHPNGSDDYGRLMKVLGTTNLNFAKGLYGQLVGASFRGADAVDVEWLFFHLGTIEATKPRDELEAMHVAQMAAIHAATMKVAGNLARAEFLPERESASRALNQLARTFSAQLETLKRYRGGAEQNVTVQTVVADRGGQAVVGNLTQSLHIEPRQAGLQTATPALINARQPAMEILGGSERTPAPLHAKRKTYASGPASV